MFCPNRTCITSIYLLIHEIKFLQVDSLKRVLVRFYGEDPLQSEDLSRIVNANHFNRVTKLKEDKKVADKIVLGGQIDEKQL
jgi:aldehyde dehydrogenase (NAD+)